VTSIGSGGSATMPDGVDAYVGGNAQMRAAALARLVTET
jgi:hypothetical protein